MGSRALLLEEESLRVDPPKDTISTGLPEADLSISGSSGALMDGEATFVVPGGVGVLAGVGIELTECGLDAAGTAQTIDVDVGVVDDVDVGKAWLAGAFGSEGTSNDSAAFNSSMLSCSVRPPPEALLDMLLAMLSASCCETASKSGTFMSKDMMLGTERRGRSLFCGTSCPSCVL